MKVGFVGLGRLGLPVSIAMSLKHDVYGFEKNPELRNKYREGKTGLYEPDLDEKFHKAEHLTLVDHMRDAVKSMDLVFFAVQTPSKEDDSFETTYLKEAVQEASNYADKNTVFVIISTVLPGTIRNEIIPVAKEHAVLYNASFIAMGTTIEDFLHPEFILIGGDLDWREPNYALERFYSPLVTHTVPRLWMSWEEAETVKMAYNTMIGFKIVYANTLMELCHRIGHTNVDVVRSALSKANRRLISSSYLRGGMGDGGACHPRDNLALSWLAKKLSLSANPFQFVMQARQEQSTWIAKQMLKGKPPYIIMGARYKPNTNLTDYSAALQVYDILDKAGAQPRIYDPVAGYKTEIVKGTYLIAIDDDENAEFHYPEGSTIIDPWRCVAIPPQDCEYVPLGRS